MKKSDFKQLIRDMEQGDRKMAYRLFASVYLLARESGDLQGMRRAARTMNAIEKISGFTEDEAAELIAKTQEVREKAKKLISETIIVH